MTSTTTEVYQGMDPAGKPSSRVLAPPGGGSSFSFGSDEPGQAKQNPTRLNGNRKNEGSFMFGGAEEEGDSPQRPASQRNASNIFGGPDDSPAPPNRKVNTKDNIFGSEESGSVPAGKANPAGDRGNPVTGEGYNGGAGGKNAGSNRGGFNPITGEAYASEQAPVHTSTKVHQPPGGASTRPW